MLCSKRQPVEALNDFGSMASQANQTADHRGYAEFQCLPDNATRRGKQALNRHSTFLTREHDYPGAKAMLYAAGVPDEKTMQESPHVGIASVWWEGNPCK